MWLLSIWLYEIFIIKFHNNNTDTDYKYNLSGYLKNIDEISKLKIPVLLLFVPRTLDDNAYMHYIKTNGK